MTVHSGRNSHPSARALRSALRSAAYRGPSINFGYVGLESGYNHALRNASNKRHALLSMRDAGVPIPKLTETDYPVVGRPDRHRAGRHFYLCHNSDEVMRAKRRGATHFMEFIDGGREFRVHIAFGKSIKIAEKIGGNRIIRNFEHGSTFMYPQDFNHKKSLRRVCKDAVESLGLDFGAVDVIWKDGQFYVLEVNTAPSLTSRSDVLDRYVKAFKAEESI